MCPTCQTHLHNHIAQLGLHLTLGAREALPQIIADAPPLQQSRTCLLGRADLDDAVDILDSAADEGGPKDTLRDLRALFLALLRLEVE